MMPNVKKGLVIAAAVAGSLSLTACAHQGSACGNTTATPVAVPVAAPLPPMPGKDYNSCKHKMVKHVHHHHHHKAQAQSNNTSTDNTGAGSAS